jgi:hypothetical protein
MNYNYSYEHKSLKGLHYILINNKKERTGISYNAPSAQSKSVISVVIGGYFTIIPYLSLEVPADNPS